jgi:hypothetical protein
MKTLHVHLAHRVRRHLGQRSVVVGTDLGSVVKAGVLAGIRVHGQHFDNPDTVRFVGSEQVVVDGSHDVMHSRSHGLGQVAVVVGRRDWVVECWVGHNGHSEANAQLEKAVASVR